MIILRYAVVLSTFQQSSAFTVIVAVALEQELLAIFDFQTFISFVIGPSVHGVRYMSLDIHNSLQDLFQTLLNLADDYTN